MPGSSINPLDDAVTGRIRRILAVARNEPLVLPNDPEDHDAWRRAVQHIAAAGHIDVREFVPAHVRAALGFDGGPA